MAVTRFELRRRAPYAEGRSFAGIGGEVGPYEQIDGVMHFAIDPQHRANRNIVDLALARRDERGRVCFEADFSVVTPSDPERGNGRGIVELPNRGRRILVPLVNRAPPGLPVASQAHPGDGFLFDGGFTIASIGWQWDVFRSESLLGLEAPLAFDAEGAVGGETMVEIRPSVLATTWLLADRVHRPLPAAANQHDRACLYVRDYEDGEDTIIPTSQWQFANEVARGRREPSSEHVTLEGGFEPGRIYQLVYVTERAPVAGTGLLALRDVAPFLRSARSDNPTPGNFRALLAFGVSQTGRMLRHFLSLGLNQTEDGERAYDGMLPHVAGARRGAFNHRFAQPSNQTTPLWGHVFPFADRAVEDPITGAKAGLLDRQTALGTVPRIIYTNTSAEYWRGDGALAHIDPAGERDLEQAPTSRSYLFSGTQHLPGYPGQSRVHPGTGTVARYPLNIVDYSPLLRAALMNLDRWVVDEVEPPPSRHPRLADASAVERSAITRVYATFPGMHAPDPARLPFLRTVDLGAGEQVGIGRYPAREGAFYPALVSSVDTDGNELAGIRLPDISVPIASHAGWNPRDPETGAEEQIVPMHGLTWLFAPTLEARTATGDPRRAIAERYASREAYEEQVRAAVERLVADGYLLSGDRDAVTEGALERYDAALEGVG